MGDVRLGRLFSTLNSSPQTTELNAGARTPSLMYWVGLGSGVAVGGGAIATLVSRKPWPLVATVLVAGGLVLLYQHASVRGLAAPAGLETESYA